MNGRSVLVTGATNGIGYEAARALSAAGAEVIALSRNPGRTHAAAHRIAEETGRTVHPIVADFSDFEQVRGAARELLGRFDRIDVLVNNAGGIYPERELTTDGHEMTWQVDYLSHYLLTRMLEPALTAAESARVITVSSNAHLAAWRGLDFEDLDHEHSWSSFGAYAEAKLADIMFAFELARRWRARGVASNAVHPGLVRTGFGRTGDWGERGIWRLLGRLSLSAQEGADTLVYLASSPEAGDITGEYFRKRKPRRASPRARNTETQRRLWLRTAEEFGMQP